MENPSDGKYKKSEHNVSEFVSSKFNEPFNEELFRQIYEYQPVKKKSWSDTIKTKFNCSRKIFLNFIPIMKWLPLYQKSDIPCDVVAGLTVAVMNIPQGMAYAMLGGCPPIVGIYMAIFPIWVYVIMGTSKHVSMGTFAVICMMAGKCVASFPNVPPVEVATAVSFIVGLWQIAFSIFKLGSLSVLLSDTMVSGFTTGAAIHVFTSQVKNLLGLKLPRRTGPMKIPLTYQDIVTNINLANTTDIVLSTCFICFLIIYNELIKPWIQKRSKINIPIPVELLVVVAGTVLSVQLDLNTKYKVDIVKEVPTGLPIPKLPDFQMVPNLIDDGLIIAIVAISINISMATIFAKKHTYEIDGNQEILASGVGNVIGSFFSCMPIATSLSRSLIQESVGGRTQLTSAFSSVLLILVLLFIGPYFEPLPYSVLSTIVVVSLKGMFLQFRDLPRTAKQSYLDAFVWFVTFLSVVCLDIDYGLGIGIAASLATMLIRNHKPLVIVLGQIPSTNIFVDINTFKKSLALPNILMFQIVGGFHFANAEFVKKKVIAQVFETLHQSSIVINDIDKPKKNHVIIQMVSVPYVDPSAIKSLFELNSDLVKLNVDLILCECTPSVYDTLIYFSNANAKILIFHNISDALDFVRKSD